jgi:hypothetical protein
VTGIRNVKNLASDSLSINVPDGDSEITFPDSFENIRVVFR